MNSKNAGGGGGGGGGGLGTRLPSFYKFYVYMDITFVAHYMYIMIICTAVCV